MSYWKGLGVAAAIDLAWIMACPTPATGPEPPAYSREATWVMNPGHPAAYVEAPAEQHIPADVDFSALGELEDSLVMHLQEHPDDVDVMQQIARVYADHGWYESAIGPLARALQLDASRRGLWSALDEAVEKSGMAKITDAELIRRAARFVEAVEMWGHGC